MVVLTDVLVRKRMHYLIVVRRGEEATYEYLKARFASVRDVDVMLDRRAPSPAATPDERRRARSHFNAFGILLVRR